MRQRFLCFLVVFERDQDFIGGLNLPSLEQIKGFLVFGILAAAGNEG